MNAHEVTGIVLAGGRSSRMGENKSLMQLNGKRMIEFSIDALRPLCSEVIISSNYLVYDFTGCEVWPDELKDQAPMVGIYSCLKKSRTDLNIILTCDMPMIQTELLKYLLENSTGTDITVPVHENGMIEPLCGIYRKSAGIVLSKCIEEGNYSMNNCIRKASYRLVSIDNGLPVFTSNLFLNINTLVDFEAISSTLVVPK
jgi:molybdopterin-guanine dinucleotide biosynthesis protein A